MTWPRRVARLNSRSRISVQKRRHYSRPNRTLCFLLLLVHVQVRRSIFFELEVETEPFLRFLFVGFLDFVLDRQDFDDFLHVGHTLEAVRLRFCGRRRKLIDDLRRRRDETVR